MHLQEIRVTGGPDVIEGVAGQFRDIGIKTNLISMDAAAFSAQRRGFEMSNDLRFAGTSSHLLMGFRVYSSGHSPRGSGMELPADRRSFTARSVSRLIPRTADRRCSRQLGELAIPEPHGHSDALAAARGRI